MSLTGLDKRCVQLTFNNRLGGGVVDLFLGGVSGKHPVKHIRLPLKRTQNRQRRHKQLQPCFRLLPCRPALQLSVKSVESLNHRYVCVLNRDTHHFWPLKHYTKPYRNYKKWHINISFTHAEHALWTLSPSVFAGLQQQPIYYVKSPISLLWEVCISGVCLGPFLSECGHAFVCVLLKRSECSEWA